MKAIFRILAHSKQQFFYCVLLTFLAFPICGYSQFQPTPVKKSNNQITVNGKNYYVHEVLRGQTLFGIAKEYNASEEDIKKSNPELNQKSVYPGMVLRIPDMGVKTVPEVTSHNETRIVTHTVTPKETLYSISRQYGVTTDDIKKWNPQIEEAGGLKIGHVLKLYTNQAAPVIGASVNPVKEDKPVKISGEKKNEDSNIERDSQNCLIKPYPHIDETLHLAVMLPLFIEQNDSILFTDTLRSEYFRYYEFLEGIYLAVDSLRSKGLNLTLEVLDTERNPKTIRKILDGGRLKKADLIIGPIYPSEIEVVAPFAKANHIPLVSPLSSFDVTKENPYAFQIRNDLTKQIELAINYLGSKYKQNVIILGRAAERSNSEFVNFQKQLRQALLDQDPTHKATGKTLFFNETSQSYTNTASQETDIDSFLSKTAPNFIILQSENEVFITEIINKLHDLSTQYDIQVFGLNQWVFDKLDMGHLYSVNLELYTDFDEYTYIDYSDPAVNVFCRKYKENWNIAPSRYSFQGFDVAYYFTSALFQFGHNLTASVPCWDKYLNNRSMLTAIKFKPTSDADGFENKAITIIRFQKEALVRKKVN